MNRTQSELSERVERQAQRLDTKVKSKDVSEAENERAGLELAALARRLQQIIPDDAAAPEETVERLARYVADATPDPRWMLCDHRKLVRMHRRLAELVPDAGLTPEQRIDRLEASFRRAHAVKLAG